MEFRFVRYPIRLRAGRFSSTFGLENQSSSNDTLFIEAGLPSQFVPPQETGVLVHSEGLVGIGMTSNSPSASDTRKMAQ